MDQVGIEVEGGGKAIGAALVTGYVVDSGESDVYEGEMGEWWITWTGARWIAWVCLKEVIGTFLITSNNNLVE